MSEESLIASTALDQWTKWKKRLENTDSKEAMTVGDDIQTGLRDIQDTVGAVAFHNRDGIAAGVSRFLASTFP